MPPIVLKNLSPKIEPIPVHVWATRIILLCYPSLLLTLKGGMGVMFFLLALLAIFNLIGVNKQPTQPLWDKQSVILSITMSSPLLAVFLSQAYHHDFVAASYDSPSRFLLAIPIFLYLRQVTSQTFAFLYAGIPLGLITGFILFITHPYNWNGAGRLTSAPFLNLIHFSDLVLILTFLTLISIKWKRQELNMSNFLTLLAVPIGIYMAMQTGERGCWLAIPPLLLLSSVAIFGRKNLWLQISVLVLICITISYFSYMKFDIVTTRVNSIFNDFTQLSYGNKDTSVGIRLQLWQIAWQLFIENPGFGIGPENFAKVMEELQSHGAISPLTATLGAAEVHNEILAKAVGTGIPGILSALSVYVIPAIFFWRASKSGNQNSQLASLLGLALITGFFIFGLTVEVFNLKMTASFFSLTIAALLAASLPLKNHLNIPE